jgi:multidrug efflux pump subunit AcrB
MRALVAVFTRHATLANIVLVVMLGAGLWAAPKMRAQYFPDSIIEQLDVSVTWDGAGADDVDRAIVQVIEPALLAVEGVSASISRASEGRAEVSLEFEPGWDMARASADAETAIASSGDLPQDADPVEITRSVWRDTVTDIAINGPIAPDQLGRLADELIARLYQRGVTRTSIQGLSAPQIVVEIPTERMMAQGVTMQQIAALIASEAATQPSGEVADGAARVRTGEERRSAREVGNLVLRAGSDGTSLRVRDVANIRVEGATRNRAYFVGPNPAMAINVSRAAQGDAIAIQRTVEDVVDQMRPSLPDGVKIDLLRTRAGEISARLQLLMTNGGMGLALVLGLLFLFLNARTAIWVAAGIPVSMMAALAIMFAAGMTLNVISIFALILTLGIVVDDAIVVGEHADFRARHLGEPAATAAERGASRMIAPVFASTITTIIAFSGLTVIGGQMGDLIFDIPFTVTAVLAASLVECLLILPNHMAHALKHAHEAPWYDAPSRFMNRQLDRFRIKIMRPFTAWVIRLRYPVLAMAVLLLATQVALLISGTVQWRFFNAPERGSITANFSMLNGASRDDTMEMMNALQDATRALGEKYETEYGTNPILYQLAQIGGGSGRGLAGADTKDADLLGAISIELNDPDLRSFSSFEFIAALQEVAPKLPLLEELAFRGARVGAGGDGIDVQISGAEASVLKAAAEDIKRDLSTFPEVSALEDSLAYDKDELILDLTPQGAALGFTVESLASELRARLGGIEAATFPDGTRTASIRVEIPEDERAADFSERMLLQTVSGQWVPLNDIAQTRTRQGFSTIRREDGLRLVSVTGDLSEDDADRAAQINRTLEQEILPKAAEKYGIAYDLSGLKADERAFISDAVLGFAICLVGIYVVLAWIFASWTRPLVVMSVIPFGLIGAVWGHYIWDMPLSMFAVVGLIGMSGILINDSIVLISTVDDYAKTRGLIPAIIDAVSDRLRAVLLTTATTVIGLAPLLYERSSSAQFLKPTVITLCYGLGFGMILVLVVVPALLAAQSDIARQFAALRYALRARQTRRLMAGAIGATVISMAVGFGLSGQIGVWAGLGVAMGLTGFALFIFAFLGARYIKM